MIHDLRIDLIGQRRWPPAGLALALVAGLLLLWQGRGVSADTEALAQLRTRLAQLQRQTDQQRPVRLSPDAVLRQQQVEALAAYLATPWGPLLGVFEAHANGRAVLLRFEPNAVEGRVEMRGRSPNVAALTDYLRSLENDPQLRQVMLSHHEAVQGEGATGIDFTLSATWAGKTPASAPAASRKPAAAATTAPARRASR